MDDSTPNAPITVRILTVHKVELKMHTGLRSYVE